MCDHAGFLHRIWDDLEPVLRHALAMCAAIISIWIFHGLLAATLGADAKLFDVFPIIYVAHIGDTIAFCRFFWKMIKEF